MAFVKAYRRRVARRRLICAAEALLKGNRRNRVKNKR